MICFTIKRIEFDDKNKIKQDFRSQALMRITLFQKVWWRKKMKRFILKILKEIFYIEKEFKIHKD